MKKILFIIGSLRAKSFNRQVANAVKEMIGDRAVVSELDFCDLPLQNQDIEQPEPASVAVFARLSVRQMSYLSKSYKTELEDGII